MEKPSPAQRIGFLQITVLLLSAYVLAALLAKTLFELPPQVDALLNRLDFFVCLVFLTEFAISFHRAPSKLAFMKWRSNRDGSSMRTSSGSSATSSRAISRRS